MRAEVYIDCGDKAKNEQIFDCLSGQKEAIAREFGSSLNWERLDTKRACRVAAYKDGNIDADTDELVEVKRWAIESLLKFKAIFPKRIEQCLKQIEQPAGGSPAPTAE